MIRGADSAATALADLRDRWEEGHTWDDYMDREVAAQRDLWEGVFRHGRVPLWATERIESLSRNWRLLVISEDWCGDASNLVPVIARLAEASPRVDLRIVKRDENPDLMDAYLTDGSRSIPIVVVLDQDFRPVGRWGPRPAELQEFVLREKRAGLRPNAVIYRDTRRWYATDHGESTLRELIEVLESASAADRG